MSTVIQYKFDQKPSQGILVESEAKNPLSTSISAMDLIGLSWIFKKDEDLLEEFKQSYLIK
ncbi:MAG: hypothetical protein HKP31_07515 [Nitrosopumilus sp.]|nr:hypothetical protein [Nitrosopumilus sp.]